MNCIDIQILEPSINTIEIETCINNENSHIDVIEYKEANIEINHCISLIDFYNHNHGNITKDGAIGSSGNYIIVTGNSGILQAVPALQQSQINSIYGNASLSGDLVYVLNRNNHTGTQASNTISDFNSAVSGIIASKFVSISGTSGINVTNNNANYTISLTDPTIQLADVTDLSSDARTFLSTPTSNNLARFITDETGSGHLVLSNGPTLSLPTLIAPILGAATATSINRVQILSSSGAVLDIASNKTLKTNNSVIFTGIDNSTVNYGNGGYIAYQNSPNFSGIPTVPTAPSGTNTNQIASTAFVRTEINNNIGSNLVIANVSGLQAALDSKQPSGSYANLSHTHLIADVSGLQSVLDSKQASGNYAPLSHTHTASNITDFNTSVSGLVNGIYAPLSSPTLTGVPLTPTASSGTNTNQIASTSFVRTEISNLVSSAPSTLDTLNELATALGNDPNFATTITNNLAGKANLNGATFTGTISGPSGNFINLRQNGVIVSISGHSHAINDIGGLQTALDNKQPSGNYAASVHTHIISDVTGLQIALDSKQPSGSYAPATHAHSISDVTNLQSVLDNKQPSGNYSLVGHSHSISDVSGLQVVLDSKQPSGSYANLSHTHLIADVSGLQLALDEKQPSGNYAPLSHAHTINDVSGLQTALDNKQPSGNYAQSSHTHTSSQITDFNSSVSGLLSVKDISAGYDISISNVSGNYTIASTNLVHVDSKQPQGFINRTDSRISVSGNIFTIAPTGSSYSFYNQGIKVIKTSGDSLTIPNLTQINYIHFDTINNQISNKTTGFDFSTDVPIAYIAWNSGVGPSGQMTFFAEERHGIVMDTSTHKWIHNTFGAQYVDGLSISNYVLGGNGTSNSHATISIGNGTLYQEDIEINITDSSSTDPFCQELSPIAQIPVYYHEGSTGQWVKNTATDYPVKYGANGPQYNLLTGGTWTIPDVSPPGGQTRYFAVWILATNQIDDPIISIMGQRIDNGQGAAENNNLWSDVNLTNLPLSEVKPLYRLIFAGDRNYTNVPKCSLHSILDIRVAVISTIAGVSQNDHGSLFGLGDDDHSQYLHIDNNRTVNAIHNFVNGLTSNGLINSTSGNFGSLSVNNVNVSISGHTHSSSNITDFNSSVSGLFPLNSVQFLNTINNTNLYLSSYFI